MFSDTDDLSVDRHLIVSHRLRARRLQLGLTQKQVVTRLGRQGIRTTNKTLSSFEHGAGVDVVRLPELAAALDCTVTYLLGLTDQASHWEPDHPDVAHPQLPPIRTGNWILGPDVPARSARPR
ncbi:helix-turn-helix protein [Kribbella voronezhensis]|uniref:Helix-turn-helix protein n=1 Tax=Kribbella voronezhensis TaxID=2512212 RepID=A0A4R7TAD3_9ACTN|nr:helix-turn-helix transcriptional regulator [Kribbella voronezhensis]TDU88599.1 helix-turn-helix protein [Kribbella voronezhensis]